VRIVASKHSSDHRHRRNQKNVSKRNNRSDKAPNYQSKPSTKVSKRPSKRALQSDQRHRSERRQEMSSTSWLADKQSSELNVPSNGRAAEQSRNWLGNGGRANEAA
jgi:hypothetical protein